VISRRPRAKAISCGAQKASKANSASSEGDVEAESSEAAERVGLVEARGEGL
jgi:hypothetical protein